MDRSTAKRCSFSWMVQASNRPARSDRGSGTYIGREMVFPHVKGKTRGKLGAARTVMLSWMTRKMIWSIEGFRDELFACVMGNVRFVSAELILPNSS